jgi:hypothetical protein
MERVLVRARSHRSSCPVRARNHLDRCSAVYAGRRPSLDAARAQMQYLAHPGIHEICNHHKAGCIEHVDEIAQILNPEDPLNAPGGMDGYRPDRIKDRDIAVGVLANTRERIGHGHAVCLSGAKHIDGPVSKNSMDRWISGTAIASGVCLP